MPKNHDLFYSEVYDGVPVYKQVCEETTVEKIEAEQQKQPCGSHVLLQRLIGMQKFWIVTDVASLTTDGHLDGVEAGDNEAAFNNVKYSAWSEDVTPPSTGWRIRGHAEGMLPAPMVNPVISTMYELDTMNHPLLNRGGLGGYSPGGEGMVGAGANLDVIQNFGVVSVLVVIVVGVLMLKKSCAGGNSGHGIGHNKHNQFNMPR